MTPDRSTDSGLTESVAFVTERDIDLLLLEELRSSTKFRVWWLTQVGYEKSVQHELIDVRHSVSDASKGESDLILRIRGLDGRRCAVMIEDKVSANPQPQQARRYRERGDYGTPLEWDRYITVITAPRSYLNTQPEARGYDAQISHEAIRSWFECDSTLEPARAAYKMELLSRSISRRVSIYVPRKDSEVTTFRIGYQEIAAREFADLPLNLPPPESGSRATWMRFQTGKPGMFLIHKLKDGCVDLELRRQAMNLDSLRQHNRMLLTDGVALLQAGESAAFRIRVPKIDHRGDASAQLPAIREGLEAARQLLAVATEVVIPNP
jgi:hypothetical protein